MGGDAKHARHGGFCGWRADGVKALCRFGAYIDRMSDFCTGCTYDVSQKKGPNACPFNYLYWAFLIRHKDRLSDNPRMAMPYRSLPDGRENAKQIYSPRRTNFSINSMKTTPMPELASD